MQKTSREKLRFNSFWLLPLCHSDSRAAYNGPKQQCLLTDPVLELTVVLVATCPTSLAVFIFMGRPARSRCSSCSYCTGCTCQPGFTSRSNSRETISFKLTPLRRQTLPVSIHLARGMCSMLSIVSRNTVLANRTSVVQRPHTTWAHLDVQDVWWLHFSEKLP